jgi:Ca2+-binding RTX toxin-like protein
MAVFTITVDDPNGGDTSLLFPGSRPVNVSGAGSGGATGDLVFRPFGDDGLSLPAESLAIRATGANLSLGSVPGGARDVAGNVATLRLTLATEAVTPLMHVDFALNGEFAAQGGVPVPSFRSLTLDYLAGATTNNNSAPVVIVNGAGGDDRLFGSGFFDSISGGFGNDLLDGKGGNDILNGGPGSDLLIGGFGDDQYFVDSLDAIVEIAGQGNDRVFASANFTLSNSAVVEVMSTNDNTGTLAINLTGNDLVNTIFGNFGDNTLDGQGGADVLVGFAGNDTYFVDNANDVINEAAGQGTADRVFTSVSYNLTLGQQVERLQTTDNAGTQAINLRGNEFNNFVAGNNGANVIAGGPGNDTLLGLGGSDRFVFETTLNASTNVDQIGDFTVGADLIMLASQVFTGLGTQRFLADTNFLIVGSRGQDADDRVLYDASNGTLHFDADGNGAGAAVIFAFVSPGTNLQAADFFVI